MPIAAINHSSTDDVVIYYVFSIVFSNIHNTVWHVHRSEHVHVNSYMYILHSDLWKARFDFQWVVLVPRTTQIFANDRSLDRRYRRNIAGVPHLALAGLISTRTKDTRWAIQWGAKTGGIHGWTRLITCTETGNSLFDGKFTSNNYSVINLISWYWWFVQSLLCPGIDCGKFAGLRRQKAECYIATKFTE